VSTTTTADPILLDVLKLLADHLPSEWVASHRLKILAPAQELTLVGKSYTHHDRRYAGFDLHYDDSEACYYFLFTHDGWPVRLAELLGEEYGLRLDLEQLTPDGGTLGDSLTRLSDRWLVENDIMCLVFKKLAHALPEFEWGDYGSLNYGDGGFGYGITLDQCYGVDTIVASVGAHHPRPGRHGFTLSDPECFEKLADLLGGCGITLDLEALA
jgi:hypothetical protein